MFGVVAGTAGLVGAFNACVNCFEFIQLGRHFEKDFGACQLKLDVVGLRLSRWGLAVGLGENPNPNGAPVQPKVLATQQELNKLSKVLTSLYEDLDDTREKSDKFKTSAEGILELCDPGTDL